MSELDLRRIALLCNFKTHLRVLPLFFIAKPVKVAVENLPDDLLIGNHVNYFERDEGLSEPDGKNIVQFFGDLFSVIIVFSSIGFFASNSETFERHATGHFSF